MALRRRVPTTTDDGIPAEVHSYQAWCQSRSVEPYPPIPSPLDALDRCYAQQAQWELTRQAYAARVGIAIEALEFAEEEWPRDFWDPREG